MTNDTHRHCYEPLVRQCEGEPIEGTVCKDWPETYCTTKYIQSNLTNVETKFVGDTKCERIQTRVCIPVNCAMVPGEEQCHDESVPTIQELPEEVRMYILHTILRTSVVSTHIIIFLM